MEFQDFQAEAFHSGATADFGPGASSDFNAYVFSISMFPFAQSNINFPNLTSRDRLCS